MALHGRILVNATEVGAWYARRLQTLTDFDAEHAYEVEVSWPGGGSATTVLTHVYADGATTLAAKVLAWAAPLAPPAPSPTLPTSRRRSV